MVDGIADAGREEEPHPSWLGVQRKVGLEVGDESWRDVDQVERWQRSKGPCRLSAGCGGPRKDSPGQAVGCSRGMAELGEELPARAGPAQPNPPDAA